MSEQVKQIVAYLTPALFWLVRRLLPVIGGALGVKGLEGESTVQTVAGIAVIVVSWILSALHNKYLVASTADAARKNPIVP